MITKKPRKQGFLISLNRKYRINTTRGPAQN